MAVSLPASAWWSPSSDRAGRGSAGHYLALLLLIVVAAALRFYDQSSPPLWGDEAATFGRVCGTYQQMLDTLRTAGFGPLHYELYWWIGQGMPLPGGKSIVPGGIPLTPTVMRFVPALAGTLMVPAMYLLARQLVSRQTALLTALLTTVSAYLLNYSRDAKMYAATWLFITLHVASLLWFVRHRSLTAWLCFVAAGCAMLGLQLVSSVALLLDVLIVLTARRGNWWALPRLALALPWAFWMPLGGLVDRIDSLAVRGSPPPLLGRLLSWKRLLPLRRLVASLRLYVIGSRGPLARTMRRVAGGSMRLPEHLPLVLPVLLGMGIAALGPIGYTKYFNTFDERVLGTDPGRTEVDLGEAGIGWVPIYNRGRDGGDLVLFTVSAYLSGWEWPRKHDQPPIDPLVLNLLSSVTVALICLLLLGLLPWRASWSYLRSRRALRHAGATPPTWPGDLRWRPLLLVGAWLLLPTYAWYVMSVREAPAATDLVLQTFLRDPAPVRWPRFPNAVNDPRFDGRQPTRDDYRAFFAALPPSLHESWRRIVETPRRWPVIVGLAALSVVGLWVSGTNWKQRLRSALTVSAMLLGLLLLAQLTRFAVYQTAGSVWMPRYLAVALPAFLIASAVLWRRLPTLPLRVVAVGLFVTVNLVQYRNRLYLGSEPPTDLMAADLVLAERDPAVHVAHSVRIRHGVEPGTATFYTATQRMYLAVLSQMPVTPRDIREFGRGSRVDQRFVPPAARSRDQIVRAVQSDPRIQTLIVWDQLGPGQVDHFDRLGDALGSEWKRRENAIYVARDHWTWGVWSQCRRRVYQRQPPPPTTAPVDAVVGF